MEFINRAVRSKTVLATLLAGLSISIHAETLVSPPLYSRAGPAGGTVVCRIFQYGAASGEPLGTMAIFANNSTAPVPLSFNTCNASTGLSRFGSCYYGAQIAGNLSHTCVFQATGGAFGRYSGTIEIQDSANNVLQHEVMLPRE